MIKKGKNQFLKFAHCCLENKSVFKNTHIYTQNSNLKHYYFIKQKHKNVTKI